MLYVNLSMHHFRALKEDSTYKLVNLSLFLRLVASFLLHVAMQDQTEKEMSVFIAQALQRVVNVVCNIYNTAF